MNHSLNYSEILRDDDLDRRARSRKSIDHGY